jgi:N-acetylglucosamine kinase-like BadF-type ATPase
MSAPFVVGVDGGNTKTLALAATMSGEIIGVGLGACSDVYGASSSDAALHEIEKAVRQALDGAGVAAETPAATAFCLAGADWPEDHELYRASLETRLGWSSPPLVVNDAFGGLWAGTPAGIGVSISCGTWGAIGARSSSGDVWHSSFWMEPSGAAGLARDAFSAVYRAALGLGEPTALTDDLLAHYAAPNPESLLHAFTKRAERPGVQTIARAAAVLLDAAARGDAVARGIVRRHGALLAEYATAGARIVGLLGTDFPIVLTGGVLTHHDTLLRDSIIESLAANTPEAEPIVATLPPAAGAALIALDRAGVETGAAHREALRSTLPSLP